jgi:hypothetical protein
LRGVWIRVPPSHQFPLPDIQWEKVKKRAVENEHNSYGSMVGRRLPSTLEHFQKTFEIL